MAHPVRRTLVADDDPDLLHLVALTLRAAGDRVATATDGVDAIELLRQATFDLVVLDLAMPRRSGLEVCRALRDDPRHDGTTVVLLTTRTSPAAVAAGYRAGCDAYLGKPFHPSALLTALDRASRGESVPVAASQRAPSAR